jgi:histidine ammonia-lyase
MKKKITLDGKSLTINDLVLVSHGGSKNIQVILSQSSQKKIKQSRKTIDTILNENSKKSYYGINTGFGLLSNVRISNSDLTKLQINLLRSHAVGIGKPLSIPEVRAAITLRANTLAQGFSGVSIELVEKLLELLNKEVHPWIPEQGSVGASGDLAPLAHLSLVLIGEGRAYYKGVLMSGADALKKAGITAYQLKAKEGLSLINGTQIMTAIGALAFWRAKKLVETSDITAALSVEALRGSKTPFDERIQKVRPHKGQILVAKNMLSLLENSTIMKSHKNCSRVQDPYSLRCIPQVHGVARDSLDYIEKILLTEINSVTDNPLVFKKDIISGGNFHGEYIAQAMDQLTITISEIANISEQRIQKLINPSFSELPAFLIKDSGINSGLMIVQVAAASLVSENKTLSHPASVDSIPTSADKEDHVSMGTIAARKARSVIDNTLQVLAMEILCSTQGLEFLKPLKPAKKLQNIYKKVRKLVPPIHQDRAFYEDIENLSCLILSPDFTA